MAKLWNYFRGYVIIKIEGLALERFINMCIARGIYLWDIERTNHTTLQAKVGIKDFKEIRKFSRRAGCRVRISKKSGYPFWMHRIKKRKMLLVGAFFCLLLLCIASTFILSVEVKGNKRVQDQEIISKLKDLGLSTGANRYFIDMRELENSLLVEIEELAWVGIEIKGVKAKIEVVEKKAPPERIDKTTPCNVIAQKEGVVEKIIARNGDALVEKGDIVFPDDILISGVIKRENLENPMYVHAYGEVYAKTYYEKTNQLKLTKIKKKKTGQKFTRKVFRIGSVELSLNKGSIPYDVYITEKNIKKPLQWRNKGLPVEIVTENYYEAKEVEESLSIEKGKEYLHEAAIKELMEEIPLEAEILNTYVNFEVKEDTLYGEITIEVLEDIAKQKRLQIEED